MKGFGKMPRASRKISNTKVYHVILRGNDKQDVFLENQDYNKFLNEIVKTKEKYNYELYAYCLMTNHVHLIIYDKKEELSKIMQSLSISYSLYFNKKYERTGHLFQNRFLSKQVEDKKYLIQLCRYIHQNPQKAKVETTEKYIWSSYQEYIGNNKIVDTEQIMKIFGNDKKEAVKLFINYHNKVMEHNVEKEVLEYEMFNKLTDEELRKCIIYILGEEKMKNLKVARKEIRDKELKKLKQIKGSSKAQISRVIGINKKIIERAMK